MNDRAEVGGNAMKKLLIIALFLLFTGCNPPPVVDPIEHGKAMFSTGFRMGVDCGLIATERNPNASHDEIRQEARRIFNEAHSKYGGNYIPRM